jgi:hypothetical protein
MLTPLRITLVNMLACLCLAFVVPVLSAQASTQVIPRETQDLLQRQIVWDENQPNGKNPTGLFIQFSKIDETTSSGKRVAQYRAYVFGAPQDKIYTLTVWKIGSEPHTLSGQVYVNAKGLMMAHKPRPEQVNSDFVGDDELQLAVQAAQAEPMRYALASNDKKLLISGTLVPFPREDTDRGCRLEVRLAQPDASAVLVYADGLQANAEIPLQLLTAGEPGTGKVSVNAQGHAVTTVYPSANGKDSGAFRVSLAIPECSVAVDIPWGKGSYHPL